MILFGVSEQKKILYTVDFMIHASWIVVPKRAKRLSHPKQPVWTQASSSMSIALESLLWVHGTPYSLMQHSNGTELTGPQVWLPEAMAFIFCSSRLPQRRNSFSRIRDNLRGWLRRLDDHALSVYVHPIGPDSELLTLLLPRWRDNHHPGPPHKALQAPGAVD